MAIWNNNDGLQVRFGNDKSKDATVGSPRQAGVNKVIEAEIRSDRLPAFNASLGSGARVDDYPNHAIPAGAHIISATLIVTTAFASTNNTAALNVGLVTETGTEIDYDGLIAAQIETGIDAVGDTITGAGALVGTNLASDGQLWVAVTDATNSDSFTGGEGRLVIEYFVPKPHPTGG